MMEKRNKEFIQCKKRFYEKNRFLLFITFILQALSAAANISLAVFIMMVVGAMENKDIKQFWNAIIFMIVILIIFFIVSLLLKAVKNSFMQRGLSRFKNYVFQKILNKPIGEFCNSLSGKYINAFSNDLSIIEINYLNGNIMIFYYMFMFALTIGVMTSINVIMTICVLLGCSIPILVSLTFGKKMIGKERMTSDANEGFVGQMKDLLNGLFVIKSFKAEKEVLALFAEKNITLEETKKDRRETSDVMFMAGQIASVLVICIVFILGVYFIFNGTMTIATVLACVQLCNFIIDPIKQLVPLYTNRRAAVGLIDKLANLIEDTNITTDKVGITHFEKAITFHDVVMKYDEKIVLNRINITFEKGKSYAIVGGSGGGKSTMLNLILGYFDNYSGSVKIDDLEIKNIDPEKLYDVVSVIQQNVFLFDKSIKDNITMFKEFSSEKIERAISMAGLSQLIAEKGIDYFCGENGSNLSGGEKQRISIARCLIRQTEVLLLDEATAALDNETAYQIEKEILSIKDLTRIIITHKLEESLLEKYDEIIVLKDGDIIEKGNFSQLIKDKGYFYSLYNVIKSES